MAATDPGHYSDISSPDLWVADSFAMDAVSVDHPAADVSALERTAHSDAASSSDLGAGDVGRADSTLDDAAPGTDLGPGERDIPDAAAGEAATVFDAGWFDAEGSDSSVVDAAAVDTANADVVGADPDSGSGDTSCVHLCPAVDATDCLAGYQRTCQEDAWGCRDWGSYSPCPGSDAYCLDVETCGNCTHQCDVVGATCAIDQVTLETCDTDMHGCRTLNSETCDLGCEDGACLAPSPVAVTVSAGESHTCVVILDGTIRCWGSNEDGQLGIGSAQHLLAPSRDVVGLDGRANVVEAGALHTCALIDDGSVVCWGKPTAGQLGQGEESVTFGVPVDVVGLPGVVVEISVGDFHGCARLDSGGVKCWGNDSDGQLGDGGGNENSSTPVGVVGLSSGVVGLATGGDHTCAVLQGGGVKCWGSDNRGQLGDGGDLQDQASPVDVIGLSSGVQRLAAGDEHSCALLENGAVKCWGRDNEGQLGDGVPSENQDTPVDVIGLSSGVHSIALGGTLSCALLENGTVKCWGSGESTPQEVEGLGGVAQAISVGAAHICALFMGGAVQCWGDNTEHQLGTFGLSPTVPTPHGLSVLGGRSLAIAAGGGHACALLETGPLMCWGTNQSGQLGNGDELPGVVQDLPVEVTGLSTTLVHVAAGNSNSCALLEGGALKCWGNGYYGELGNGGTDDRSDPVDVVGLSGGVSSVALGTRHMCAVLDSGALKCWGQNTYGQLGVGIISSKETTPVAVVDLSTGVREVAAGLSHTCAVLEGGSVKCWGRSGWLGAENQPEPVDIAGLSSGVVEISMGQSHVCARFESGSIKCWGEGRMGQLGHGEAQSKDVPTEVINLDGDVDALALGTDHSCALMKSGNIFCWGSDEYGELGDGADLVDQYAPVPVQGLSGQATAVAAGGRHTCALMASGTVECWGSNSLGEVGGGDRGDVRNTPSDVTGLPHLCQELEAVSCSQSTYRVCQLREVLNRREWSEPEACPGEDGGCQSQNTCGN